MTRLFIDIVGPEERRLDFTGQLFSCAAEASEAAHTMSLDLAVAENSPWVGAEVQVKDEAGTCLFTYPVGQMQ